MRQLTAVAIAGICVLAAACGGNTEKSSTSTTTSAPPPPVAVNALEGLLLPPPDINAAMGAKDMSVAVSYDKMSDVTAELSDNAKDCQMVVLPAQLPVYTDSRWTAVRGQSLREPGGGFSHTVDQAVVSFPAAADAAAFYNASGKRWAGCSNRNYTRTPRDEPAQKWTTQAATNTNGTLSIRRSQEGGNGWTCQRALTVRNNVAVDVLACGYTPGDFGVNIAHKIAVKVARR
ncbi:MAG: sensor domain-containing protein [Mycobacterium sp.]